MFASLSWDIIVSLLSLGVFAGFMAGLLGVGGGLIIVPALILIFSAWHFPGEVLTQMAVASSLATIVFTSLSSIYMHHRNALVQWQLVSRVSVGIVIGSLSGVLLAISINGSALQLLFGLFAVLVAVQMFFQLSPQKQLGMPGVPGQVLAGVFIAGISSVFGIGGGSVSVPLFSVFGLDMRRAVASSAACGFPIALVASIVFALGASTPVNVVMPEGSVGYVYVPAVFIISFASVLCAPLGAKMVTRISARQLKKVFSVFLCIVGLRLIFSAVPF